MQPTEEPTPEQPSQPSEPFVVPVTRTESAPQADPMVTPTVEPVTAPEPAVWTPEPTTVASTESVTPTTEPVAPVAPTMPPEPVATPEPTPVVVASPVVSAGGPGTTPPVAPKKKSRKKFWIFGGVTLLVILLAAGGVFAWYLPNTPDNVYKTAITRSGTAVNTLVQNATSKDKLEALKTSKISGTADITFSGSHFSGDFTTSFDKTNSNGNLNVTYKDAAGTAQNITLKGLTQIPSGSVYPNLYFQATGLKALGLDSFVPGLSSYEGKWIFVSSTYLQSLGDTYLKTDDNTKTSITTSDVAEAVRTVSSVSQDYLFSTDSNKAVLEKKSYVGKENVDGIQAYHYKVSVNVAHAKAYCKALGSALQSTDAYKKLTGHEATATEKTATANQCETADYGSLSDTYDMWIDGHYKLIYKVRFYDKKDHGSYADVGQLYKGGDKLSLFVRGHDTNSKTDGSFTLDTDLKSNETTGILAVKGTDAAPYDVKINLKAELNSQPVQVTVPTSSVKIEDVLKQLGLNR